MKIDKSEFRWLLNCAMHGAEKGLREGSERRTEMQTLINNLASETGVFDEEDGNFHEEFVEILSLDGVS